MKRRILIVLYISVISLMVQNCTGDFNHSLPTIECEDPLMIETNTIEQILEMYRFGGVIISDDLIVSGYVTSSDEEGSSYKTLTIQDAIENATSAMVVRINFNQYYTKFEVGRKVFVKMKGLAIGYSYGQLVIGKLVHGNIEGISKFNIDDHILRSCERAEIIPKIKRVKDINHEDIGQLIKIENVQFSEFYYNETLGNSTKRETVERSVYEFNEQCELTGIIPIQISGFSSFKNVPIPKERGSVVGVLSSRYDDLYIEPQGVSSFSFELEKCPGIHSLEATNTIEKIRESYSGKMVEFGVEKKEIIEGYVVSTDEFQNFKNELIIQDSPKNPTYGLRILIASDELYKTYKIGDRIIVSLNKLYMDLKDGVLTIGVPEKLTLGPIDSKDIVNHIIHSGENQKIEPLKIDLSEIEDNMLENCLVALENVQLVENEINAAFGFFTGMEDGLRTLEICGLLTKLKLFTRGESLFANHKFPNGNGELTAIKGRFYKIRNESDVNFYDLYETCPKLSPKILITEVSDPKNNTGARFIEIYNSGEVKIKLKDWYLRKYVNGAKDYSSNAIDLSDFTILPKEFLIISNSTFFEVFKMNSDITSNYISGNGDDVYELVNDEGEVIDVFGVVGEDGSGKTWEYTDGKAVRNLDILKPNSVFNISEWAIFTASKNPLHAHPNSPKLAPQDFGPNLR